MIEVPTKYIKKEQTQKDIKLILFFCNAVKEQQREQMTQK
jgi:hypothetical protein